MSKHVLIFIHLFTTIYLLPYLPMYKKDMDIDIDNVCFYEDNNVCYVYPCNDGYYCHKENIQNRIGICQKYNSLVKKLGDSCDSNFECDINLTCYDNICTIKGGEPAYNQIDKVTGEVYFFCPDSLIPKLTNNDYICELEKDSKLRNNNCFFKDDTETVIGFPKYFQVKGETKLKEVKDNNNVIQNYEIEYINNSYIGTVDNDQFVENEKACKSGFALYFYGNKKLTKPSNQETQMFKLCVNVTGVEKLNDNCYIKYTKDGTSEYVYNVNKLNNATLEKPLIDICGNLMTKLNLFNDYFTKMNEEEILKNCKEGHFYDEPFTCGNNDLRKKWFFYNNPEYYLIYGNESDIIDYMLKEAYPLYKLNDDDSQLNKTSSNQFLKFNVFVFILILLFL